MEGLKLSVIICTHNPNLNYIAEVLESLRVQTYPQQAWELILIDNASDIPLSQQVGVSGFMHVRCCREEKYGIVFARIKGMREARADLILFVDDDNILMPDYIEKGLLKSEEWPIIGVWGGQQRPRFESIPPDWTKEYWKYFAVKELACDLWSNLLFQHETTPPSAGMFIRKCVWTRYLEDVAKSPERKLFFGSRRGAMYVKSQDTDLAFTACDIGLGTARFKDLILIHIIPDRRLREDYLVSFLENAVYSYAMLEYSRGKQPTCGGNSFLIKVLEKISLIRLPGRMRRFYFAEKQGIKRACRDIQNNVIPGPDKRPHYP